MAEAQGLPADPPSSTSKSSKAEEIDIFTTCFQCTKKQLAKPTLYLLQCMHTACRDCLTVRVRESNEYVCKCSRIVPKNHIVLVNRIVCKKGQCQQSLACKQDIFKYCRQCDLSICCRCLIFHDGHEILPPRPFQSCTVHPKMPAKYVCGCGDFVCHACATGYRSQHKTHQKQTQLPPARIIDSCERFNKGICTLQNTTRVTFDMFNTERERLKNHFRMLRIDLSKKTMDIVNATLRKMNDCVLAMELFELSYMQKYEENVREYAAKQTNMANFKKLCNSTADNNPLNEFLPYITDISTQISTDVSHFTNKIVEAIKSYSQPPEFQFDTKQVMELLHSSVRFRFQNQIITPPVRTDPSVRLIDVPIDKLAQHPLTSIAGKNRRPGDKRKGGPLEDAVSAKKNREPTNGPRPYEIAGTSINHRFIQQRPNVPLSNVASSSSPSPNVNIRMFSKVQPADPRTQHQHEMHRSDPRVNPKMPLIQHQGPRLPMPSNPRMLNSQMSIGNALRTGFSMNKPNSSPVMSSTLLPRMPQQQVHYPQQQQQLSIPPPRFRLHQQNVNQLPPNNYHSQAPLQRAPIVPVVKDGAPITQKFLMDIIKSNDHSGQSIPRSINSGVSDTTRVITPVVNNHAIPTIVSPTIGSPPLNPPLKLTLRRNPPSTSVSESPEKEEKKPAKIDDWDDYCFVCSQGCDEISGELVCCETCPKVYHNVCHMPIINGDVVDLPDDWRCTRCKTVIPITEVTDTFTEREKLVCARVLLSCYEKKGTVLHSEPFHNPVPRSLKRYYDLISNPICFKDISKKISNLRYENVQQFIDDMNLVFKNCCAFNRKGTAVELSCRVVFDLYSKAVKDYLRPYHSKIWLYQNSPKL